MIKKKLLKKCLTAYGGHEGIGLRIVHFPCFDHGSPVEHALGENCAGERVELLHVFVAGFHGVLDLSA